MSVFKAMRSGGSRPMPERFFGEVVSYKVGQGSQDTVTVKVVGTGEERTIGLDPNAKIENIKEGFDRPGVEKFARKGKSFTEPGGVLRIEDAVRDAQSGTWQARWISSALHQPKDGYVLNAADARVSPLLESKTPGGSPYRMVDILQGEQARRVVTAEQFEAAVVAAVKEAGAAFIRVSDGQGQVRSVTLNGGRLSDDVNARVDSVLADERFVAARGAIGMGLSPGEVVEVVPMKRMFFGADSATSKKLDAMFLQASEDGQPAKARGFGEVLLTVQVRDDGSEFVSGAIPKSYGTKFSFVGKFDVKVSPTGVDEDFDLGSAAAEAPAPRAAAPGMR